MGSSVIEHVVVLMLENRSFDHFLGYLYPPSATFDGLSGAEYNREDPADPASTPHAVTDDAASSDLDEDAGHDFEDVHEQLFGSPLATPGSQNPGLNSGFVRNYERKNSGAGPRIMKCFNRATLPVLSRLAEEFAVCDHWYSSMPGPTWPNRLFVHTGSSDGQVDNKYRLYHDSTVFNLLGAAGKTWSFYLDGHVTQAMALTQLWSFKKWAFRRLDTFKQLAAEGTLLHYSFLEPRYFRIDGFKAPTDQHPPHAVHRGEQLVADVYKAVRTGPLWEKTLLIVTYDEHGGLYDHVHPPSAVPPGPVSNQPPFDFDRYGVRVPAVVVSPYIASHTVVNEELDHTSIIATLRKLFGLGDLRKRDAVADSLLDLIGLEAPRTDAPIDIRDTIPVAQRLAAMASMAATEGPPGAPTPPLSDYQEQLLAMTRDLADRPPRSLESVAAETGLPPEWIEDAAAREIEENVRTFLSR
jgi:phospholipase C